MRMLILSIAFIAGAALAQDAGPPDPPGKVRYDADGNAQMWGGPPLEEITDTVRLQLALAESVSEPILLFKHSTRCPISARAAARVAEYAEEMGEEAPPLYWLKVIESRPVSDRLAERLGVKHESPQIILVKDGNAVWDASHDAITAEAVTDALERLAGPS